MTEPSTRRMSFAVRTTTAFMTSPFFTRPRGIASFTDTTMISPTEVYLRFEPPRTLMHITRRAPELSATSRFVCIWIMALILSFVSDRFPGQGRIAPRTTPDGDLMSPALHMSRKAAVYTSRPRQTTPRKAFLSLRLVDEHPGLEFGERLGLFNEDRVAHLGCVVFVVCVVVLRLTHGLLHDRVRETAFHLHNDRLVLLVADNDALQNALRHLDPL